MKIKNTEVLICMNLGRKDRRSAMESDDLWALSVAESEPMSAIASLPLASRFRVQFSGITSSLFRRSTIYTVDILES